MKWPSLFGEGRRFHCVKHYEKFQPGCTGEGAVQKDTGEGAVERTQGKLHTEIKARTATKYFKKW